MDIGGSKMNKEKKVKVEKTRVNKRICAQLLIDAAKAEGFKFLINLKNDEVVMVEKWAKPNSNQRVIK